MSFKYSNIDNMKVGGRMSLLKNCDECNMTCCPNYNPWRIPKDFGKQKAREALEKAREECKKHE